MNYKCELIEQNEEPVLSIRTRTAVGNLSQEFAKSLGAIMQYYGETGEKGRRSAFFGLLQ